MYLHIVPRILGNMTRTDRVGMSRLIMYIKLRKGWGWGQDLVNNQVRIQ